MLQHNNIKYMVQRSIFQVFTSDIFKLVDDYAQKAGRRRRGSPYLTLSWLAKIGANHSSPSLFQ